MAYQAKRRKPFRTDFELVDENGEIKRTIQVVLDADDMVVNISRKYAALTKAMFVTTEMKRQAKNPEQLAKCIAELGEAVVNVLEAVFGVDDAKVIIDFYDGRYVELSQEVLPFISTVVVPKLVEIRQENRKNTMAKYNRKKRHKIGWM